MLEEISVLPYVIWLSDINKLNFPNARISIFICKAILFSGLKDFSFKEFFLEDGIKHFFLLFEYSRRCNKLEWFREIKILYCTSILEFSFLYGISNFIVMKVCIKRNIFFK